MIRRLLLLVLLTNCGKGNEGTASGGSGSSAAARPRSDAAPPARGSSAARPASPQGCDLLTKAEVEALGKMVEKVSPGDGGKRCTFKLAGSHGTISIMFIGHRANHDAGRTPSSEPVPGLGVDAYWQPSLVMIGVNVAERQSFFVQSTESSQENAHRKEELIALARVAAERLAGGTPALPTPIGPVRPVAPSIAVCELLKEPDFQAVGLVHGRANPTHTAAGGGCTWDPVHGKGGGFLHVELVSAERYAETRDVPAERVTMLTGIGDEAMLVKTSLGTVLQLRKGARHLQFSGTALLPRERLEPLARAAVARL